jgi:hypothetical protein
LPAEKEKEIGTPPQQFERVEAENHEMNWVRAIKGQAEATSRFEYASRLTETMLLGLVSLRAGGRKLRWDAEDGTVTNVSEANQYLARQNPRKPWTLSGGRETVGASSPQK